MNGVNVVETDQIENKQSLNEWREIVETIAAFATSGGGIVHVGVGATGERVGVQIGQRSLENLADQIKANTEPPQYPSMTLEGEETSAIITLRVEESPVKPVWAFGRPFKRVGRTNQRLSPEETHRLWEITTGRTWDALPCAELCLEHLDRGAVEDFLRKSGQDPRGSTESVLQNLGLMTAEGLTNGAALLFAQNPQRFVVGSQVKCGRFLGLTSVQFLDEQTLDGTVMSQVDRAMAFVTRNTRQGIRFTGRPEREIVPEYPTEAVREAITNAVCHRDYAASGTVQVRIYDDRLEVWNPGTLPMGLTVEQLYREHTSRPRNRLVAGAFYRARLIEHWGTGTVRMARECEAAGLPRPEFITEVSSFFIVRFRNIKEEVQVAPLPDLSARQLRAVEYVRVQGRMTTKQYRETFHVSDRQALRDLNDLVGRGILVRRGSGAASHYVLFTTVQDSV
jgi:ATP-dependent DNA helicase RecG